MRHFLATIAAVATLGTAPQANAQGIPVIDTAGLAQAVAQVKALANDYQNQLQQLSQLQQQYQNMVQRLQAITGPKDFSAILNLLGQSPNMHHAQIDMMITDVINNQITGPFAATVNQAKQTFGLPSLSQAFASQKPPERAAAQYAGVSAVTLATGEAGHAQAKDVTDRATTLQSKVGQQADLKASVDYNTLVLTEIAKNQAVLIQLLSAQLVNDGTADMVGAQGGLSTVNMRVPNAPN